jgi:hypothetical protein
LKGRILEVLFVEPASPYERAKNGDNNNKRKHFWDHSVFSGITPKLSSGAQSTGF